MSGPGRILPLRSGAQAKELAEGFARLLRRDMGRRAGSKPSSAFAGLRSVAGTSHRLFGANQSTASLAASCASSSTNLGSECSTRIGAPAKPKQQSEDAKRDEDEGCNQAPPLLPSGRLFDIAGLGHTAMLLAGPKKPGGLPIVLNSAPLGRL